ncbi:MAG: PAS domain-containing protein [Hyphomonadaceae bacterium]|nr:PAS domain-containing protein [Hyphomonadaceae bacterium]
MTQAVRSPPPDAEHWLEALPAPVLGVDAGERVRFANAAAAELLAGFGRGILGRRLSEIFGAEAPLTLLARRALAAQQTIAETELTLSGPGFSLGRASVAAAPVGEGFLALVLQLRARARAAGPPGGNSAARTLAHEVRNPLAGIRAAAQLVARDDDPELRQLGLLICEEVDRIRRLTERLDPVQHQAPKRARVNIHEALERVRLVLAPTYPNVKISERYDPSLPDLRGDLDQLIQAFLNIAKNAAEAALSGSDPKKKPKQRSDGAAELAPEIVFVTRFRPGLKIRAAATGAARPQLEALVIDNGPGLDPAIMDRLFLPFATTKSNGMGLGLTVAADIIGRHDGRIEVESAPGATTFRVLLPLDPENDAP